jgi:type 1 fimbria pilin
MAFLCVFILLSVFTREARVMKWLLMILMMLFFGQAGNALAACTATIGNIDFGDQHVGDAAPVGTEFASAPVTVTYHCDSSILHTPMKNLSNDVVFQIKPSGMSTARDFVYRTAVEGVGIRLREESTGLFIIKDNQVRFPNATSSFCWRQMSGQFNDERCGKLPPRQCPLTERGGQCSIRLTATLVKLGPTSSGSLNGQYANIQYYSPGVTTSVQVGAMRITGSIRPRTSCTMRDLNVDLGSVSLTTLKATGSLPPKQFDLSLTGCDPQRLTTVFFSTPKQVGEDCDGIIANSAGAEGFKGAATGVGIRVTRHAGTRVCWYEDIRIGLRPSGIISFPMQAAMMRLTPNPSAGSVVGKMFVHVTYR